MGRPLARAALASSGLLLALLGLEVTARVLRARADADLFDEATFRAPPLPRRGNVSLGHLIRVAENPDQVYELRPDVELVAYAGAKVSTNREGFRDRNYEREKPPGVVRVVGLGDSVMFGQGVGATASYLSILERRLAEGALPDGVSWEIVNAAVPGYNTAQEVALLEARGLAFEPDLVVLGFVSNDVNLPSFLAQRADVLALDRSFALDWFAGQRAPRSHLAPAPTEAENVFRVEDDAEDVPEKWRHLVGWLAVERALDRLAELRDEHGFEVLVFCHRESEHTERALEAAAARGFETANLGPRVDRYLAERDIPRYHGSELTVSEADPHPSELHHDLAADGLFRALERTGLLDRLGAAARDRRAGAASEGH